MSYKDSKITLIVKTMENTGSKYEINGVDVSKAVFFYREETKTNAEIPLADYNITTESDVQYLNITNSDITDVAEDFQVIYVEEAEASEYNPIGTADVTSLVAEYNKLVTDVQNVWEYVEDNCMTRDTDNQSTTLPELADGESWYWDADEGVFKGMAVTSLEAEMVEHKADLDSYELAKEAELDTHTTDKKAELVAYVEVTTKPSIDTYVEVTTKPSIDSYVSQFDIPNMIDTAVADLVNSAPTTLDTLNEIATALGNDSDFATNVYTELGTKALKTEVGALTDLTTTEKGTIVGALNEVKESVSFVETKQDFHILYDGDIDGLLPSNGYLQLPDSWDNYEEIWVHGYYSEYGMIQGIPTDIIIPTDNTDGSYVYSITVAEVGSGHNIRFNFMDTDRTKVYLLTDSAGVYKVYGRGKRT